MLRMNDTYICTDQPTHAATSDSGINPVGFRPVMRVHIGLKRFDDEIGIILPLAFSEFAVMVGTIFLDTLLSAMVNGNDDQFSGSRSRKVHEVLVDRPAAKRGSIIKQVLGVLEV